MLDKMLNRIDCPICGAEDLQYNPIKTMYSWSVPEVFKLEDVDKLVDGIISDVLIFECFHCKAEVRYTFKEIEKLHRKKLSDNLLTLLARDEIEVNPNATKPSERVLIYCGKCSGFDGRGACPIFIHKDCKLKRFPNGL